ncbi:replicative DNA helicase [Caballeronia pedi]|uniref:Replicative DNA helicase n=1 Tax=Caballeronia pedi TaxID=1777141 RepID=A0A158B291_9BURK|nr:DnaB-like helicase N-terminal domain-containing protein [Caballeronia pedi]SAK63427.1 replicative DNA helicase [Caballeronia pedi]
MIRYEQDRRTRAEQNLLSALLRKSENIRHCMNVRCDDFSHDQHGMIFASIRSLIDDGEAVNVESVHAHMQTWHRVNVSTYAYLLTLAELRIATCYTGLYAAAMLNGRKS